MSWLIVILVGMLTTRFLEAMVPLFMKTAIDSLEAREPNLFWPVVGILTVVGIRFCLSIFTSNSKTWRIDPPRPVPCTCAITRCLKKV